MESLRNRPRHPTRRKKREDHFSSLVARARAFIIMIYGVVVHTSRGNEKKNNKRLLRNLMARRLATVR